MSTYLKKNCYIFIAIALLTWAHVSYCDELIMDFEGLQDDTIIVNPYPRSDISFSNNTYSLVDYDDSGSGDFANEPSSKTIMFFDAENASTLNCPYGFTNRFSFAYTAVYFPGSVTIYEKENGQGAILHQQELETTTSLGIGDTHGKFDNWRNIDIHIDTIARSVLFSGTPTHIGFDDLYFETLFPKTRTEMIEFVHIRDQYYDRWFQVAVVARDETGTIDATNNQPVQIASNPDIMFGIRPAEPLHFVNGTCNFEITFFQEYSDIQLMSSSDLLHTTSNSFEILPQQITNLDIEKGYNSISFGISELYENEKEYLFDTLSDTISIYYWNTNNSTIEYAEQQLIELESYEQINTHSGLIIIADENQRIETLKNLQSPSLNLAKGWNFVGFNVQDPRNITTALSPINGKFSCVWTYEHERWFYFDPEHAAMSDLDSLLPGRAYWIHVLEDCTLSLPNY